MLQWGTVRGTIVISGDIPPLAPKARAEGLCPAQDVPDDSLVIDPLTRGVGYVAVYIKQRPDRIHPSLVRVPDAPVRQAVADCRILPHFAFVRVGQPIDMLLSDPIPHNIRFLGFANQPTSFINPPGDQLEFLLKHPERLPVQVQCDLHPYMQAWWLVLDHPYGTVSDVSGRFELPLLPYGEHELTLWHERTGYLERALKVTVQEPQQDLPPLCFPVTRFVP